MRRSKTTILRPTPGGVKKGGVATAYLPASSRVSTAPRPSKGSTSQKVLKQDRLWERIQIDRVARAYVALQYPTSNNGAFMVARLEDALHNTHVLINHYRKTGKRGIVLAAFSDKGYDPDLQIRFHPASVKMIREDATVLENTHMEYLANDILNIHEMVYKGSWSDDAVLDNDYIIPYAVLHRFEELYRIPPQLRHKFERVSRWIKARTPQFVVDNSSAADLDNNPAPLRRIERGAKLLLRRRSNKRDRNESNRSRTTRTRYM